MPRPATTSKMAGAAIAPSASSPPIQTAIATSAANRSASIPLIIIVSVRGVDWRPWGAGAFARARAEGRPVLLFVEAPWCTASLEMARTTYADSAVEALVHDRFVPIRVDADRRPDIAERYTLGGLPTTAFLDPDGNVLGGGTFVPIERMAGVLTR